ncbi:hypothetical protein ACFLXB_09220 [Chloroflexota bacterium]
MESDGVRHLAGCMCPSAGHGMEYSRGDILAHVCVVHLFFSLLAAHASSTADAGLSPLGMLRESRLG